jgi:hypothetical protein
MLSTSSSYFLSEMTSLDNLILFLWNRHPYHIFRKIWFISDMGPIFGFGAPTSLDLCLELKAFSSEGSFMCHTYCDTGPPFLRSYPKDPRFYLLNAMLLTNEQSLPILNVLRLTRPAQTGLELMTYRLLSERTTTGLQQDCQKRTIESLIVFVLSTSKWTITTLSQISRIFMLCQFDWLRLGK